MNMTVIPIDEPFKKEERDEAYGGINGYYGASLLTDKFYGFRE
jgi:hypothetical protein